MQILQKISCCEKKCPTPWCYVPDLDHFWSEIQRYRPAFLILHIGGNDLDKNDDFTELAVRKLVAFLTHVRGIFQIRKITILTFIPRMTTRYINYELYNSRVIQANQLLKHHCANAKFNTGNCVGLQTAETIYTLMGYIWTGQDMKSTFGKLEETFCITDRQLYSHDVRCYWRKIVILI